MENCQSLEACMFERGGMLKKVPGPVLKAFSGLAPASCQQTRTGERATSKGPADEGGWKTPFRGDNETNHS
jgi:hypothetical protein